MMTAAFLDYPEKKYIVFRGQTIELTEGKDRLWRDTDGTIYGFADTSTSVDDKDVCGVGPFSLAVGNPLNDACKPHDYVYQSPAYQMFHKRSEADHYLEMLLRQIPGEAHSLTPGLFELISRQEGFRFWENPLTND